MRRVLRGGKWGSVGSNTGHGQQSTSNYSKENELDDNEQVSQECFFSLFEDGRHFAIACLDISGNQIQVSKIPADDGYESLSRFLNGMEEYCCIVPASHMNNESLTSFFKHEEQQQVTGENTDPVCDTTENYDENENDPNEKEAIGGDEKDADDESDTSSAETDAHENDDLHNLANVHYLPNSEFSISKALQQCSLLSITGMPPQLTGEGRIDYLSHILGGDDSITRALGGLISFGIRNNLFGFKGADGEMIHVDNLTYCNFCNSMRISPTTMKALRVFSNDMHPVGRGSLRGKEGLSLYGILQSHIRRSTSRHILRSWLMYPSTSLSVIQERQDIVSVLRHKSSRLHLNSLKNSLRGVGNIPLVIHHMRTSSSTINDYKSLQSSALSFSLLVDSMKLIIDVAEEIRETTLIKAMLAVDEEVFRRTIEDIDQVVNFEESISSGRLTVAEGCIEEIDQLKQVYAGLEDVLTSVGLDVMGDFLRKSYELPMSSLKVVYENQVGFMIAIVSTDCETMNTSKMEELGLSLLSADRNIHYFKDQRCRQLDDEIGDLLGTIYDLEDKAFRQLEVKLLEYSKPLLAMMKIAQELDCLQAFATAADEYSWVTPIISDDCEGLVIVDGRHPLLDLTVPSFVPNTTRMKTGDVNIVTGPNYSGKSVYLSQAALIVILAHIGSCVPAKRTRMCVIDAIFTRVSNFESISYRHSSFFDDASQVSGMLAEPPTRSLNLIDEFGKGTSEVDGVALLLSTLRKLLKRTPPNAPLTLCVTHFTDVLKEPYLPLSSEKLSIFSMEVIEQSVSERSGSNQSALQVAEHPSKKKKLQLIPGMPLSAYTADDSSKLPIGDRSTDNIVRTYKIRAGSICQETRALQCALEAGIEKNQLRRVAHISAVVSRGDKIQKPVASIEENDRFKGCVSRARALIERNFS